MERGLAQAGGSLDLPPADGCVLRRQRNFEHDETSYDFEECTEHEATAAIFASEPLTENHDGWLTLEFGEIVFLEKKGGRITRSVSELTV